MGRASKISLFGLKLLISGGLLYLLAWKIGGKAIFDNMRLIHPVAFLAATLLYLFQIYISSLRWRLLIPDRLPIGRVYGMFMTGSFFNICLPGLVGGDGIKAYYLGRELQRLHGTRAPGSILYGQRMRAVDKLLLTENIIAIASVFMDRYIGLSALLFLGTVVLPFSFEILARTPAGPALAWFVPAALFIFLVAGVLMLKLRFGERLRVLYNVYDYISLYSGRKDILLQAFLYSICVQCLSILSVYILSQDLNLQIPILSLLVFLPIIILLSFLPISISGIGVREGAFAFLLPSVGVSSEMSVTLSLLWFLSVVTASLWGAILYLRMKTELGKPQ